MLFLSNKLHWTILRSFRLVAGLEMRVNLVVVFSDAAAPKKRIAG
jgi:hypothetical protein